MHGLVVLDAQDKVIRPILWNDGRTQAQVEYLNNVGKENLSKYTANIAFGLLTAPNCCGCAIPSAENFAKISKIMLPKDYINLADRRTLHRLLRCFRHAALLDVQHKCWSKEMLDICGVSEAKMPKCLKAEAGWHPDRRSCQAGSAGRR